MTTETIGIFKERYQWAATMVADMCFLILWYLLRGVPDWAKEQTEHWITQSDSWLNQFVDEAFPFVFTASTFIVVMIVIIRDIGIMAKKSWAKLKEEEI